MGMGGINTAVDYDVDETIYGNNDKIDAHLDAAEWPLPLIFRFGVSRDFALPGKQRITVAADGVHPNNNVETVNMGLEYGFSEILFLRLGRSHLFGCVWCLVSGVWRPVSGVWPGVLLRTVASFALCLVVYGGWYCCWWR